MVSDREHFHLVAQKFCDGLGRLGLKPIRIQARPAEEDGWFSRAAVWARGRPHLSVWLDKWLETSDRHFWFGFEGPQKILQKLREDLAEYNQPSLIYDERDTSTHTAFSLDAVRRTAGLVDERYPGYSDYLGKYDLGLPTSSDDQMVAEALAFVEGVINFVEPPEEADVREVERRRNIGATMRQALIQARRGQGSFRRGLEELWGSACAVTGCQIREALRASHIKPWRSADDTERLDPRNGLLLTASIDALFDRGLVTFDENGSMLVSPAIGRDDEALLGLTPGAKLNKPITPEVASYLRFHRDWCMRSSDHVWRRVA